MELVTSECNTLLSSFLWGQKASEKMKEIKLLLICRNNYSEKISNREKSAKRSKPEWEDPLHELGHLPSLQAVTSKEVLSHDWKGPDLIVFGQAFLPKV